VFRCTTDPRECREGEPLSPQLITVDEIEEPAQD
jgi:hypothetical protein